MDKELDRRLSVIERQLNIMSEQIGKVGYTGLSCMEAAIEAINRLHWPDSDCDQEHLVTIVRYVGARISYWGYDFETAKAVLSKAAREAGFTRDGLECHISSELAYGTADYDLDIGREVDRFDEHTGHSAKVDQYLADRYYWNEVKKFGDVRDATGEIWELNPDSEHDKEFLAVIGTHVGRNAAEWGWTYEDTIEKLNNEAYSVGFWHKEINTMLGNFSTAYVHANADRFGIKDTNS